jgi:hypothetical protein
MTIKTLSLKLDKYKDEGLYIETQEIFIELTHKVIKETADDFWNSSSKISSSVKDNVKFHRCTICPLKEGSCDTFKAILPFLEYIDYYKSFDEVVAIYKSDIENLLYLNKTTMQDALKSSAILALTRYCKYGEKYKKYFKSIIPTMSPPEIAERLYLNAFFIHKGEIASINKFIETAYSGLSVAIERLIERISLLCQNDAFLNAFVETQAVLEYLTMNIKETIENKFNQFVDNA